MKKKKYKIVFHKDFGKGWRLWLCKNCGYPSLFAGVPMIKCDCKKPKPKIYKIYVKKLDGLEQFITDLQDVYHKKKVKKK